MTCSIPEVWFVGISFGLRLSIAQGLIFDENAVPPCRIIHKDMGDSAYQFPVLNNRAAAHE